MEPNLTSSVPVESVLSGRYGRTLPNHRNIPVTEDQVAVLFRGEYPAVAYPWDNLKPVEVLVFTSEFPDEHGDRYVTLAWESFPRYYVGCDYCEREKERGNTFFPSHKAMPHCRSGGRNHCTCDGCF